MYLDNGVLVARIVLRPALEARQIVVAENDHVDAAASATPNTFHSVVIDMSDFYPARDDVQRHEVYFTSKVLPRTREERRDD